MCACAAAVWIHFSELVLALLHVQNDIFLPDHLPDFKISPPTPAIVGSCLGAPECEELRFCSCLWQNDKGQIPAEVVPDPVDMPLEMADAAAIAKEIKQMLLDAVPLPCTSAKAVLPNSDHTTSRAMLTSLGLKLGDRVVIAGQKVQ